jgi:hypothetical protein
MCATVTNTEWDVYRIKQPDPATAPYIFRSGETQCSNYTTVGNGKITATKDTYHNASLLCYQKCISYKMFMVQAKDRCIGDCNCYCVGNTHFAGNICTDALDDVKYNLFLIQDFTTTTKLPTTISITNYTNNTQFEKVKNDGKCLWNDEITSTNDQTDQFQCLAACKGSVLFMFGKNKNCGMQVNDNRLNCHCSCVSHKASYLEEGTMCATKSNNDWDLYRIKEPDPSTTPYMFRVGQKKCQAYKQVGDGHITASKNNYTHAPSECYQKCISHKMFMLQIKEHCSMTSCACFCVESTNYNSSRTTCNDAQADAQYNLYLINDLTTTTGPPTATNKKRTINNCRSEQ